MGPDPLTTNAERKAYFEKSLMNKPVRTWDDIVRVIADPSHRFPLSFHPHGQIPTLASTMKACLISKNVASLAGSWSFTFKGDRAAVINVRVTMIWKKYARVTINGEKEKVRAAISLGSGLML